MKTRFASIAAAMTLAACGAEAPAPTTPHGELTAFVQLFEWGWPEIARECEEHLGPAGYTAVQVSPPNEHIEGPAWWTRYQPVSYRIESRGGTREEFAEMVDRCREAGVGIYADAVINHMAGFPEGRGIAGSAYSEYDYPAVPYSGDDFHRCGHNEDDRIEDYQDLLEIQNCQLGTLDDLDTGKTEVQDKIAAYLNDLLGLGVGGFRIDAAKHMHHEDLHQILQRVDDAPFVYQEVIDRGGEAIDAMNYVRDGHVTEFKYAGIILDAFELGNLYVLEDFWSLPGWLPSDNAVVFVDNHDIQRGHAFGDEVVNYKDGARYELAVAFMLAHPYGYPLIMSSYAFENDQQGPPTVSPFDIRGCGEAWICEHRRPSRAAMLAFRGATAGAGLTNWVIDGTVVSFSRGDLGHILLNTGPDLAEVSVPTNLPVGDHAGIISGIDVTVTADGTITLTLEPFGYVALLADD